MASWAPREWQCVEAVARLSFSGTAEWKTSPESTRMGGGEVQNRGIERVFTCLLMNGSHFLTPYVNIPIFTSNTTILSRKFRFVPFSFNTAFQLQAAALLHYQSGDRHCM